MNSQGFCFYYVDNDVDIKTGTSFETINFSIILNKNNYQMTAVKRMIFIICFLFFYRFSDAQETLFYSWDEFAGNWQLGLTAGPDFYYGDLNKSNVGISHNVSGAAGVFVIRQVNNFLGVRGGLLIGGLTGKNFNDVEPRRNFSGIFSDNSVCAVFDFTNLIFRFNPFRKVHVYGTGGIGLISWSITKRKDPDIWTGSGAAINIPAGLGVFYTFANRLNIGMELTTRLIMSDYLDQEPQGAKFFRPEPDRYHFLI
ncbi:MAG: hypothetical protein WCI71_14495 [Bacteroidota bacterium]